MATQDDATADSLKGEFELIEDITKDIKTHHSSTKVGIGDDAAVIKCSENTVVSTDLLIEGVHFNLSYMPLKHLGYKAVVVNLSDIYAMNAMPTQITVSLAFSNRFPLKAIRNLYEGIKLAAEMYKVDIVGGDTTTSTKGMVISITALGFVDEDTQTLRSGAKNRDLIAVTGDLGNAYLGYQILERERQVFEVNAKHQPDLDSYAYLIERQLKPEARKDIPPLLKTLNLLPTSMIDISDGLSSELIHICKASEVGCVIYENKIPMSPQLILTSEELNLHPLTAALNGGEDYELLFTLPQEDYPKIKGNPNFTVIGYIAEKNEGNHLITNNKEKIELKALGWDGFSNQSS